MAIRKAWFFSMLFVFRLPTLCETPSTLESSSTDIHRSAARYESLKIILTFKVACKTFLPHSSLNFLS